MSELPDEVRAAWDDFWCRLVTRPDGTLDEDAVKSELHDYKVLLDNVPKVYEHITGGRMSKPHYEASDVIAEAEEHYERERRELFAEELRDEAVIERAARGLAEACRLWCGEDEEWLLPRRVRVALEAWDAAVRGE